MRDWEVEFSRLECHLIEVILDLSLINSWVTFLLLSEKEMSVWVLKECPFLSDICDMVESIFFLKIPELNVLHLFNFFKEMMRQGRQLLQPNQVAEDQTHHTIQIFKSSVSQLYLNIEQMRDYIHTLLVVGGQSARILLHFQQIQQRSFRLVANQVSKVASWLGAVLDSSTREPPYQIQNCVSFRGLKQHHLLGWFSRDERNFALPLELRHYSMRNRWERLNHLLFHFFQWSRRGNYQSHGSRVVVLIEIVTQVLHAILKALSLFCFGLGRRFRA